MSAAAAAETPSWPASGSRVRALSAMSLAPPRRRASLGGRLCGPFPRRLRRGGRSGLLLLRRHLGVLEGRVERERDRGLLVLAAHQVDFAEPALATVFSLRLPAVLAGVLQVAHEGGHRGQAVALALELDGGGRLVE